MSSWCNTTRPSSSSLLERYEFLSYTPTDTLSSMRVSVLNTRFRQQKEEPEDGEPQTIHPNKEQLSRRCAIVPEQPHAEQDSSKPTDGCCSTDNVIIVPHVQISTNESHLFNRAITSGGGILADLQRATIATQAFYAEMPDQSKNRSPWILKRLYEWSNRAKRREIIKHVQAALEVSKDHEIEDDELEKLLVVSWEEMFEGATDLTAEKQKYLQAVWELFHSELIFLHRQLLVLRNVYKEPLKKIQVEGCLLLVEPDLLFGNLDQLLRISRTFCQSFLTFLQEVEKTTWNCTNLVVQLFEKFSKGPSTISAYQAYCINYKATMEYLGSIRQKEERFIEFEKICLADERCFRLQLEDLLIAPLQRITRLPILLREISRYTENEEDRQQVDKVIESMNENLRSIDDSVQWLHNFERLQQLQTQVVWPSIAELEPRSFIPDFLKVALSRQFCENLLAHPRRKIIHEGPLQLVENGRIVDVYALLFNDMFVLSKTKRCASKIKVKGIAMGKSEHYIVQRQPVPLDSCIFCDADSNDSTTSMQLKFAFVIIHLTRYYQVVAIYTLQAADKHDKDTWIEKFQESIENYESIQLKDMLKCTPLFTSLSLRRCSSSRLMTKPSACCSKQQSKEKLDFDDSLKG